MPFIHARTNIAVPEKKELSIKEKLGEAITIIPGKSEGWLMLQVEDNCHLYFKGDNSKPIAFVELKLFGNASNSVLDNMTNAITEILAEELEIAPAQIYVKYELCEHWGWNGSNF